MSNVLVTLEGRTDWLDPLRWGILTRIAAKRGGRVANVLVGDSIVEERALQNLVDAGWAFYRDDTVERPLAGPNVYLTPRGEEAVRTGREWIRSIGTSKTPKTSNRAAWRGLSKGRKASSFNVRALRRGTKSEQAEHGLAMSTARRIAMDHLTENPRYYSKNRANKPKGIGEDKQIVVAWLDERNEIVRARRTDLGERPEVKTVPWARAVMWSNRGKQEDLEKGIAYARAYGHGAVAYVYSSSEKDPLGRARAQILGLPGYVDVDGQPRTSKKVS